MDALAFFVVGTLFGFWFRGMLFRIATISAQAKGILEITDVQQGTMVLIRKEGGQ